MFVSFISCSEAEGINERERCASRGLFVSSSSLSPIPAAAAAVAVAAAAAASRVYCVSVQRHSSTSSSSSASSNKNTSSSSGSSSSRRVGVPRRVPACPFCCLLKVAAPLQMLLSLFSVSSKCIDVTFDQQKQRLEAHAYPPSSLFSLEERLPVSLPKYRQLLLPYKSSPTSSIRKGEGD